MNEYLVVGLKPMFAFIAVRLFVPPPDAWLDAYTRLVLVPTWVISADSLKLPAVPEKSPVIAPTICAVPSCLEESIERPDGNEIVNKEAAMLPPVTKLPEA